jgi:hypothetical protein
MTQTPRIVYRANEDVTREVEISALVNVYRFVLVKKEATRPGSPDDPERRSDEIRAKTTLP